MSDLSLFADSIRRPLSPTEIVVDELMEHFVEAREVIYSGSTESHDGHDDRLLLMPQAWRESSYPLLEQLLVTMRNHGAPYKRRYWHLAEWYLRCERRREPEFRVLSVKGGGTTRVPAGWVVRARRHPSVDEVKVLLGVETLVAMFSGSGVSPRLPRHVTLEGKGCRKPLFGAGSCRCGLERAAEVAA